mmetsp:Transcript_28906/g.42476  ORF Transcript_28906/g.42476 Transcript_28906/m.42476 type:complete len:109 (+) Transcript_28906:319-645(+)
MELIKDDLEQENKAMEDKLYMLQQRYSTELERSLHYSRAIAKPSTVTPIAAFAMADRSVISSSRHITTNGTSPARAASRDEWGGGGHTAHTHQVLAAARHTHTHTHTS